MSIAMPGHPLSTAELTSAEQEFDALVNLIESHDVVFLLTDSRESRWLPTLLAANQNKVGHSV